MITRFPDVRGRQRLLATLDGLLGPTRLKCPAGISILGYASSTQDRHFLLSRTGNDLLSCAITEMPRNGTFIDCGANCGFYSALAATHLQTEGKVLSIEPSLREYSRLAWAIAHNTHSCQWLPLNLALGDASGVVSLDLAAGHTGMNSICRSQGESSAPQRIAQFTLDGLVAALAPAGRIDLMKIDVEGYEMAVLRGARTILAEGRIKALVVEVTDRFLQTYGSSKRELYDFLRGFGYTATVSSDEWQYDELFVL